ncbi:MAG: helix-turn-helix domain-containing protein [Prevotellaceae bacterium]|jgi:hypothetical protein|nr:helix-turn-helix domain-containing protein [Prevotellaceae bacterium]
MEVINIEKKAFETMITRFEILADKVQVLCRKFGDKKLNEWYDNQDVCLMLRISPRTLQTLRDNGTLPYTQINRKLYYKPQDVHNVIKSNHLK